VRYNESTTVSILKKLTAVAHGGSIAADCRPPAPATAVSNRHGLQRLDLQPPWPTTAAVRNDVWWSNLINFETVI
jgi:hypothetical protein